jgi:hypothetical protein
MHEALELRRDGLENANELAERARDGFEKQVADVSSL